MIGYFEQPIPTLIKGICLMAEAEMRGKVLWDGLEESAALIGMTEAQRIHIETLDKEIQQLYMSLEEEFLDRSWNQLTPEEVEVRENKLMNFLTRMTDDSDTRIRETLTPAQLQIAREYHLAIPTFMQVPMKNAITVNFDAYEALDLDEGQRKQFQEIHKEIETEYKKVFEKIKTNPELANDPQKLFEAFETDQMITFSEKMKAKIDQTLTPEQRERLTKIKEDIPKKIAEI